ncbi:hypothetical protein [Streptomyces sp. NPDC051561]|uniref:hypothetical protein n=1 Tax=Streptomyces sp. NPDC051561 TaxID=3365658 RepID=UPI00378CF37F
MLRTRHTPRTDRDPSSSHPPGNALRIPLPTVAQCVCGAVTVVFSTLAMLLLSQTTSGAWIAVIACAALGLGLLVAMTVPMPRTTSHTTGTAPGTRTAAGTDPGTVASPAADEAYGAVRVPGPRPRSSVGEHSLHG